jgi:hypothetical protein
VSDLFGGLIWAIGRAALAVLERKGTLVSARVLVSLVR